MNPPVILFSPICIAAALFLTPSRGPAQDSSATPKPSGGAVLHFDFDGKPQDGMVRDKSGKQNHGKLAGARHVTNGKKGGAYQFSWSNQSIRVPGKPALWSPKITYSVWCRVTSSSRFDRHLIDNGSFVLGIAGMPDGGDIRKKDRVFVACEGRRLCYSEYAIADGTWVHVAATCDGSEVRLYLNGRLQGEASPLPKKGAPREVDFLIGMTRVPEGSRERGNSLNGFVDEVSVYPRALTAEEVQELGLSIDPSVGKAIYTKRQVIGMYNQLKRLYADGLITDEFFEKKVRQLEAGLGDEQESGGN